VGDTGDSTTLAFQIVCPADDSSASGNIYIDSVVVTPVPPLLSVPSTGPDNSQPVTLSSQSGSRAQSSFRGFNVNHGSLYRLSFDYLVDTSTGESPYIIFDNTDLLPPFDSSSTTWTHSEMLLPVHG